MLEGNRYLFECVFDISFDDNGMTIGFKNKVQNLLEPGVSELACPVWDVIIDKSPFRI